MNKQLYNSIQIKESLVPKAYTATTNGTTVDRRQSEANFQSAVFALHVGDWTDGTHTFAFQESADGSSWSAVAVGDLDGEVAQAAEGILTLDTNPTNADTMTIDSKVYLFSDDTPAQGTLTLDTIATVGDTVTIDSKVYTFVAAYVAGVSAQATLTLDTIPTNADTMTIDGRVYTFQDTLTDVDGNIQIGASLAQCKQNIIDAINLTGAAGIQYAASMTVHATVDAATSWTGDNLVLTVTATGVAGNSVVSTETFTAVTNVFDAATFGTTTAGVDAVAIADVDGNVSIGADAAGSQSNLQEAIGLTGTAGQDYAASMTAHTTVTMAAFAGNDAVLTAVTGGVAGNSIATTETFTAGTNVFDAATLGTTTLGAIPTNADGTITIAPTLAGTKTAIVGAINLSGTGDGTDYAALMTAHPTVSAATAFIGDTLVLTADSTGVAGNSIATTETFTAGTNVFDAATLGTAKAGTAGAPPTIAGEDDDDVISYVGYNGDERYLRIVNTVTNAPATGLVASGFIILGEPDSYPVH